MGVLGRSLGKAGFNGGGGAINWFPGHMAAATRVIRERLKLADLVIEVRDARIPVSSANTDLQNSLSGKRRVIALNKKDLANPNIMHRWYRYFEALKQDSIAINAHSKGSVKELLTLVELKLKEVISREPTLLVMVVGIPNVGKSALINSIHQIASSRFPVQDKTKRATVGPLPGVTQDIAGYKIANKPSIYVLDTPGILVPSISDMETGLKLALTGAVKDSVVGEERIAKYFLSILNTRNTPLHWKNSANERQETKKVSKYSSRREIQLDRSDIFYIEDIVREVQRTLHEIFISFNGDLNEESELEYLVEAQLSALKDSFKIATKSEDEARNMVSKKIIALFRTGKLGPFILDNVPEEHEQLS